MEKLFLEKLKELQKTVFQLSDIYRILGIDEKLEKDRYLKNLAQLFTGEFTKKKVLVKINKNIFAYTKYDPKEVAMYILTGSYVSFETVLEEAGVYKCPKNTLTCAAYVSRKVTNHGTKYVFREIKEVIFKNNQGISESHAGQPYRQASLERAFLDFLYVNSSPVKFNNLQKLNKEIIQKLLPIYNNKSFVERVNWALATKF